MTHNFREEDETPHISCKFPSALWCAFIQQSFGVCWLLEASAEKMEGLISSVTSYLHASVARKA
jgi:hypothetical protein